jgi:sec-independent protein translocase protein TatB
MSAAEIMILLIVGIVVVGPKRLPKMMRTAGQWVAKMRRLSSDLRSQSGIDRIIREEGLEKEIRELRALKDSLSKQALLDSLVKAADAANAPVRAPMRVAAAKSAGALATAAATSAGALPSASAGSGSAESTAAATPSDAAPSATRDTSEGKPEGSTSLEKAPGAAGATDGSSSTEAAVTGVAAGAAALYRPAEGAIPRMGGIRSRPPLVLPSPPRAPYRSFRAREFPSFGVDHYDAIPDDLAEDELEGGIVAEASESAVAEPPAKASPLPSSETTA